MTSEAEELATEVRFLFPPPSTRLYSPICASIESETGHRTSSYTSKRQSSSSPWIPPVTPSQFSSMSSISSSACPVPAPQALPVPLHRSGLLSRSINSAHIPATSLALTLPLQPTVDAIPSTAFSILPMTSHATYSQSAPAMLISSSGAVLSCCQRFLLVPRFFSRASCPPVRCTAYRILYSLLHSQRQQVLVDCMA
jgi:hypothetical protein